MILELEAVFLIRLFCSHCQVTFSFEEIFSYFCPCLGTFPYMELLSFSNSFVQWIVKKNQIFLFKKRLNNQIAAVMLQVTPSYHEKCPKTDCSFLQTHTKTIFWAKSSALPTTTPKCAFYPMADVTFFCRVMLKSCCRKWAHCDSHINNCTVSTHPSSIGSVENLLSRAVKCLILCSLF